MDNKASLTITLKRITGLLLLVFAVAGTLNFLGNYSLRSKNKEVNKLKMFYCEDKDSLDFVIIGASEVKNGYSAAEVYKESGITNFPYYVSVNPVHLWKYEINEILREQSPKLIMLELNGAVYEDDETYTTLKHFHKMTESIPLSFNKVKMIHSFDTSMTDRINCYFPALKYHSDWSDLYFDSDLYSIRKRGYALLRSEHAPLTNTRIEFDGTWKYTDEESDINPLAEQQLRDFLDFCKEANIENIIFVQFPHLLTTEEKYVRYGRYNTLARIIKEYGYEYRDFNREIEKIGIAVDDYYDSDHLNAMGQKKISDYIAKLLVDEYGLERSSLSDKQEKEWNESARYITLAYDYYNNYYVDDPEKRYTDKNFTINDSVASIKRLDEYDKEKASHE